MSGAIARAQARVGTVLKDKWRLDKLLGVGGMASVFAATHRNQKRVAVKMLHPELSSDAQVRTRFSARGLPGQHGRAIRGAVAVDDDDVTDDGLAFLVMELLEGETLDVREPTRCRAIDSTSRRCSTSPISCWTCWRRRTPKGSFTATSSPTTCF